MRLRTVRNGYHRSGRTHAPALHPVLSNDPRAKEGDPMAKALYGHLAASDPRLAWENDRLRARVAELQATVDRLAAELAAATAVPALDDALAGVRLVDDLDELLRATAPPWPEPPAALPSPPRIRPPGDACRARRAPAGGSAQVS